MIVVLVLWMVLVWMDKPLERALKGCQVGAEKFLYGRKKKFGMTLQAICDLECRFLDIGISKPGTLSDYLIYCTSPILQKCQKEGFLKAGLTNFGDTAYITCGFMTAPFKGVVDGSNDAFNFLYSQVRINIECAFGRLVHKWGCIRTT